MPRDVNNVTHLQLRDGSIFKYRFELTPIK